MSEQNSIYSEQYKMASYLVDARERITPSAILRLLQDVAGTHAGKFGLGWERLHETNMFWALSRLELEIERRPRWHEQIEIVTWPKAHNHLVQPRDYEMRTLSGECLVRATSNWVILDAEGKPQMLSDYDDRLVVEPGKHAIERPAARLRTPVPNECPCYCPVLFSDLDMNQHANNASYLRWVINSFGTDFVMHHELKLLSINYIQQTHASDRFAVQKMEVAEGDFLCSIYSESQNAEVCRLRTLWQPE